MKEGWQKKMAMQTRKGSREMERKKKKGKRDSKGLLEDNSNSHISSKKKKRVKQQ